MEISNEQAQVQEMSKQAAKKTLHYDEHQIFHMILHEMDWDMEDMVEAARQALCRLNISRICLSV